MNFFVSFINDLINEIVDKQMSSLKNKALKVYMLHMLIVAFIAFFISFSVSYVFSNLENLPVVTLEGSQLFFVASAFLFLTSLLSLTTLIKIKSKNNASNHNYSEVITDLTKTAKEIILSMNTYDEVRKENDILKDEILKMRAEIHAMKTDFDHTGNKTPDSYQQDNKQADDQ